MYNITLDPDPNWDKRWMQIHSSAKIYQSNGPQYPIWYRTAPVPLLCCEPGPTLLNFTGSDPKKAKGPASDCICLFGIHNIDNSIELMLTKFSEML